MALRSAGEHNFQVLVWTRPPAPFHSPALVGATFVDGPYERHTITHTHRPQTPTETSRALRARVMTAGRPSTRHGRAGPCLTHMLSIWSY